MQRLNTADLNRQTAASTTALVHLDSFQSTEFNVAALVEGLMEEDVKGARTEGGSESMSALTAREGYINVIP